MARHRTRRSGAVLLAAALAAAGVPAQAQAQGTGAQDATMVRLIELLVQNGVLARDQAQALMAQAQREAGGARPAAPRPATPRGAVPAPVAAAEAPEGAVRVTYVPEAVRRQIAEEVRRDLAGTGGLPPARPLARIGDTAAPQGIGQLTDHIRLFGDLRMRGEGVFFPRGNATGIFPNFNGINNSTGFDTNGANNAPFNNVTDNRTRFRLRARTGIEVTISDGISMIVGAGTGNDSSPVSTNQTLGSPGNFSKYALWLDRAYFHLKPLPGVTVDAGRFPNPFFSSPLLYHPDLNMDGVAAQGHRALGQDVSLFGTVGAFPVFNTAFDFGTTNTNKYGSRDAYLGAAQLGVDWRAHPEVATRFAAGYHAFINSEGKMSRPCFQPGTSDSCSTDNTRPLFTQGGNTMYALRDNVLTSSASPNLQYYGLASAFRVVDVNARADITSFGPYTIRLDATALYNTAYDRRRIAGRSPVNNLGANGNRFQGGGAGYLARVSFGEMNIAKAWDWNVFAEYRYLQSDAVIDAFNDSDFRLGGTNSQGYILGGTVGVARNTLVRGRWLSGREVSGAPYRADVLQVDLLGRF